MYNTLKYKIKRKHQGLGVISFIFFNLFLVSCGQETQSSGESKSELINKINAVHKQIMVQGNISEEEQLALTSLTSLVSSDENFGSYEDIKDAIPFDIVENVPVYPGCESLSQKESKQCFLEKVNKLVREQFNTEISKSLGITEQKNVEVFFMIDKNGARSHLKVREANVVIQAEVARVLKQLPSMKPAIQNGKAVKVMCSTVIVYGG